MPPRMTFVPKWQTRPVATYGRDGAISLVHYPVQADNTTHRAASYVEGRLLMQDALPPGTHDPDDPLRDLQGLAGYYRYYYPDGRLFSLKTDETNGDGIRAAYRADGSLLMARGTKADGKTETWWSAGGKPAGKRHRGQAPGHSGIPHTGRNVKRTAGPMA